MLRCKRIISMCLSLVMMVTVGSVCAFADNSLSSASSAVVSIEDAGMDLINTLVTRQGEAFKTGNAINTSDIFVKNDNTDLYNYYLTWYIGTTKAMEKYWTDYKYDLKMSNVDGNEITIAANLEYGRATSKFKSSISNYFYKIELELIDGKYYIKNIDTNEENYASFLRLTDNEASLSKNSSKVTMENKISSLIADAYKLKQEFDSVVIDVNAVVDMEKVHAEYEENGSDIMPRASYAYNGERGRNYADKYHSTNNPYFYVVTNGDGDCTNYVSQCIWAAYGGWTTSDTNAQMQANINNGKRMQAKTSYSNWFAGSGGGGAPWESVVNLWNFAIAGNSTGPRATGVNNNATYKNIAPSSILTGQVLQFRYGSSGNYRHSAYVSGGVNDKYDNIIITQHSSSSSKMMLDEVIANWGGASNCQMRQLKFTTANFNS